MNNVKIIEVTKDNYQYYINQIVSLENSSLSKMEENGQEGQFFTTGYDDILEYVLSRNNTVMVAVDNTGKVVGATYITEGQIPYTYNDITKYFKTGEEYDKWVRSQYSPIEYRRAMIDTYKMKIEAYKEAKKRLLKEYPQYSTLGEFLNHELHEKENEFHEKSDLRNKLNQYMSEYIMEHGDMEKYERFYYTTSRDIATEFGKDDVIIRDNDAREYEELLSNMNVKSLEQTEIKDSSQYYRANTKNSIEIDTYITDSTVRGAGIAKILVFEGIKKHINRHFEDPEQREMFLCSTLHRFNVSSKYVSEFFDLTDSVLVNRRYGRTREVHITKIERDNAKDYLKQVYERIAFLHDYNPEGMEISKETRLEILQNEIERRMEEAKGLIGLRHSQNYTEKYHKYLYNRIKGMIAKADKLKKVMEKSKKEDHEHR